MAITATVQSRAEGIAEGINERNVSKLRGPRRASDMSTIGTPGAFEELSGARARPCRSSIAPANISIGLVEDSLLRSNQNQPRETFVGGTTHAAGNALGLCHVPFAQ